MTTRHSRTGISAVRLLPLVILVSLFIAPALAGRIYISKSGTDTPPYSTPATATESVAVAFDSLNAGVADSIIFYESGFYLVAQACTVGVNGAVITTEPGQICTLARDVTSPDSTDIIRVSSDSVTISGLALDGNGVAGIGVRLNGSSHNTLAGLDIYGISVYGVIPAAAIWGHNVTGSRITGCDLHDLTTVGGIYIQGGHNEISGNRIYNVSDSAGICLLSDSSNTVRHNLVYDCLYGIIKTGLRDTVAYNTVFGCDSTGIRYTGRSVATEYHVYRYNISWGNSPDLDYVGTINGWDDTLNCYNTVNGGMATNADDVRTYPQFADTSFVSYDFHLQATSPCIDTSGDYAVYYDLDGTMTPQGTSNDLGCYEHVSGGGGGSIDSVHYYSCGTPGVADDSMIVWFSENIEYDSLPFGAGSAEAVFNLLGAGAINNAAIETSVQYSDTNFIFILMNAGDTVLSHKRARLALEPYMVYTTGAMAVPADTDTVVTHNIWIPGAGTDARDLNEALAYAFSTDSIIFLDAGLYDDPFTVNKDVVITSGLTGDSLPVITNRIFRDTVFYAASACTVIGIKFKAHPASNPNLSMMRFSGTVPRVFAHCVFDGSDTASYGFDISTAAGPLIIDSSTFTGFRTMAVYSRTRDYEQRFRANIFQNCNLNIGTTLAAIHLYPAGAHTVSQFIENNVFYNLAGGAGVNLRASANVRITNNLIERCYEGIKESFENSQLNIVAFNTVVQCTSFGIQIRNASGLPDTVRYNISWSNNGVDFDTAGAQRPLADYNFFQPNGAVNWIAGANSDSGYPGFVDTTVGNYRLASGSPCIDFTDWNADSINAHQIPPKDVMGYPRVNGATADAGAYEDTAASFVVRYFCRVNKTMAPPGDTLLYKMFYDNDGPATPDSVRILQQLPAYVVYDSASAGGVYHIGESGTQIRFSSRASATVFDRLETWANMYPDSVAGIRWSLGTAIGAQSGGDSTGAADDTVQDSDAGYVRFRVIIK